jgi:hypothetical protein
MSHTAEPKECGIEVRWDRPEDGGLNVTEYRVEVGVVRDGGKLYYFS